jgi:hypothetical protein
MYYIYNGRMIRPEYQETKQVKASPSGQKTTEKTSKTYLLCGKVFLIIFILLILYFALCVCNKKPEYRRKYGDY